MFKNIVAGYDGSTESVHALRLACDLARKYDSEVHIQKLFVRPLGATICFRMLFGTSDTRSTGRT
jgi:nucleotide-binding universal stress UspA family protein